MKVLIINTTGKTGSIGKIAYNLLSMLKKDGMSAVVCYGRNDENKDQHDMIRIAGKLEVYYHVLMTRITGYTGIYSYFSTKKLIGIIKKYKPDIVQLFNLHGYYINDYSLLKFLKANKIPTVYSMLDEYPYLGRCCYSYDCEQFQSDCKVCKLPLSEYPKTLFFNRSKEMLQLKKEAYEGFENIIFTAPIWAVERAKKSTLLRGKKLEIIDEFVDTESMFYPRNSVKLREKLGLLEEQIVILNVAPFSNPRKGVEYFLQLAQECKNSQYIFVNVGYDIDVKNLPHNFIPIRYVKDQEELATYYSLADLLICTSLADTMPNVCLEALACGTPICGFDIAGTPSVCTNEEGTFVSPRDVKSLLKVTLKVGKKSEEMIRHCRRYAQSRYSKETYYKKIKKVYLDLLERKK